MLRHQLATQSQRILLRRMGNFVDKSFEINRVLVQVHAAPETRWHMRIAHRVIHQQRRERITNRRLWARWIEALKHYGVFAVANVLWRNESQDRLPRDAHRQPGDLALVIEPSGHLALGDRVEAALRHIFFARPDHLDRCAGHLLADGNGHPDKVGATATPEAAAEVDFVHLALRSGQACRFRRSGQCGLAVLCRHPHLAALGRPLHRRVHRLHADMILMRVRIHRLNFACCTGNRGRRIAHAVADHRVFRVETGLQRLCKACTGHFRVGAFIPLDFQCIEGGLRAPPRVRDHHDGIVAHAQHFHHAGTFEHRHIIDALDLAAKHRTGFHRRIQHAGHFQIHAVDLASGGFVYGVEACQSFADDAPVFRVFQLDVGWLAELRRCGRHFAVGRAAFRCRMRYDAFRYGAFGDRYFPLVGCRLHQHHARRSAALADVVGRAANAATAAGGEVSPHPFAGEALPRRRILGADFRPVAFKLFRDHLREASQAALTHLGARDADDDFVVGLHHDPGVDLSSGGRGDALRHRLLVHERHMKADDETGRCGGAAFEEAAPRRLG